MFCLSIVNDYNIFPKCSSRSSLKYSCTAYFHANELLIVDFNANCGSAEVQPHYSRQEPDDAWFGGCTNGVKNSQRKKG